MRHNKVKFKLIIPIILAILIIVGITAIAMKSSNIYAEEITIDVDNYNCVYDTSTKQLTVTGTGPVTNTWRKDPKLSSYIKEITTVTIADTIIGIEDPKSENDEGAFEGCTELTKVEFLGSSTCTKIGKYAFKGCVKLSNIKVGVTDWRLPISVETIGDYAFSECEKIRTLRYGNQAQYTSIGEGAFSGCKLLTEIYIPDTATSIGKSAFSGCERLTTLTIGTGVTSIGENAFKDVPLTTQLTYNAINCTTYNNAFTGKQIATVKIGDSVTVIPKNFIKGNTTIKNIILPKSVNNIETDAFNGCRLTDGIWIRNMNCTIATISTISKYTTVFVEVPAEKKYASFVGLKEGVVFDKNEEYSDEDLFSTLLYWLYANEMRYSPYATMQKRAQNYDVTDMGTSQSTIMPNVNHVWSAKKMEDTNWSNTGTYYDNSKYVGTGRMWAAAFVQKDQKPWENYKQVFDSGELRDDERFFVLFPSSLVCTRPCGSAVGVESLEYEITIDEEGSYDVFRGCCWV